MGNNTIKNHKGIHVKSSVYPAGWNPKSDKAFNSFAQNIIKQLYPKQKKK